MAITKKTVGVGGSASVKAGGGVVRATPATTPNEPESERSFDEAIDDPDSLVDGVVANSKDFANPEPGRYEGVLVSVKSLKPNEKGLSIQAHIVFMQDDGECRRDSMFFKMLGEDLRTPDEWGPVFYNRFMGKLGYTKENRGKEAREELTEKQPAIIYKISPSKSNKDFVNREIEAVLEDDEGESIDAIRDWLENNPF